VFDAEMQESLAVITTVIPADTRVRPVVASGARSRLMMEE